MSDGFVECCVPSSIVCYIGIWLQRGTPGYMAPELQGFQNDDEVNSCSVGKGTKPLIPTFTCKSSASIRFCTLQC